jgi:hypothetical protein
MAADISEVLKGVEDDLRAEFKPAHLKAQALQFVSLFVAGFLASLIGAQFRVTGWEALVGLAAGAAGAAVRQTFPQIPWLAALGVVQDTRTVHEAAPAKPSAPPASVAPFEPRTPPADPPHA